MALIEHVLGLGQSNMTGTAGDSAPALSTTQPFNNLMLAPPSGYTGPRAPQNRLATVAEYLSGGLTPLVEADHTGEIVGVLSSGAFTGATAGTGDVGETPGTAMMSYIASRNPGFRGLWSVAGRGGTSYADLALGTDVYTNGRRQLQAAHTLCTNAGNTHKSLMEVICHGETDYTSSTYGANMVTLHANLTTTVQADTSQTETPYLCQVQTCTETVKTSALQQLAATYASSKILIACPSYHLAQTGGHRNAAGHRHFGSYAGRVYNRVIKEGGTWTPLQPISLTISGKVITCRFNVPVKPLVFDTTVVAAQTDKGFEYSDSTSSATISSVAISGDDAVIITLSAVPTGTNRRLQYGITASKGNLRDSDGELGYSGEHLYNWCLLFDYGVGDVATIAASPGGGTRYTRKVP